MWKPSAITSGRCDSSDSSASAGGQDEQPCEVNSSTTTGRVSACVATGRAAKASAITNKNCFMRIAFPSADRRRCGDSAATAQRPARSHLRERLLSFQIVLDKKPHDLVDVAVAPKAERIGAPARKRLRPAADDRLD